VIVKVWSSRAAGAAPDVVSCAQPFAAGDGDPFDVLARGVLEAALATALGAADSAGAHAASAATRTMRLTATTVRERKITPLA
jgi:hypothetical protein